MVGVTMKLYKIINSKGQTERYREAKSKRQASSGKTMQEKVILFMNEKQYAEFTKGNCEPF